MKRSKPLLIAAATAALVVLGGELFARYALGLGTPSLFVTHPTIEYLFKPNQDLRRFGNHIIVNQYGMRAGPIAPPAENQYRIMIFGDSVTAGGNQTGHADLATTRVHQQLAGHGKEVVVGNISAKSWGPGNWLAYAREHGFFAADVVVLVLSSHDLTDVPTFAPLNKNSQPTRNPPSALLEGITRYLPRYLPRFGAAKPEDSDTVAPKQIEAMAQQALGDLEAFLRLAMEGGRTMLVFQHWERGEVETGEAKPGNARIRELCERLGIQPISLQPYFRRAIDQGANPYRDYIHPNETGQRLIADAILDYLPATAPGR